MQRLFIARSWYLGSDSRLEYMNCVYKTGLSRNIMTDAMIQNITVTEAMIQGMVETIKEWAKNAMPEGQKLTPNDYKAHFPDIMRWEKKDRKKLKEGIENWLTDMDIEGMREAIHKWAYTKCIQLEAITPNDYKAEFPEIKDWDKVLQKRLKKKMIQWLEDEPPTHAKNRKNNTTRRANTLANKDSVQLTPEQAAAKIAKAKKDVVELTPEQAAAKERKRVTDRAYKERMKEKKALGIANGGVSKKETVKLTPEQAAAKKAAAKERKRETDRAYKERMKEKKALGIANGGVSKKETVKLTPEQAAAKKAAANERKRENAKKLKECIREEKNEIEELVINSDVLNELVHLMVINIKEEDTEDDTVLVRDLFRMAEEDRIKHEAIECLRRKGVKTFRYFRRDQIFESWVLAKIRCFNQTKIVDTEFMNTNFPISDPVVYNQQVASDTSAGCDVSANPSVHGDNVSDSSCDSDEDEHLSDVDEDEHLSDSDKDEPVAKKDEDERLSDVGSDSGCESDGDGIVVTPEMRYNSDDDDDDAPASDSGCESDGDGIVVTPEMRYNSDDDDDEDAPACDSGCESDGDRIMVTPGAPYSRSVSPARSPAEWYDRPDSPGY